MRLAVPTIFIALIVAILPFDLVAQPSKAQMNEAGKNHELADLEIQGVLPLSDVVELLRKQHPDVNFVLAPGVDNIIVGKLRLRNATMEDELEAAQIASGMKFSWGTGGGQIASGQQADVDPVTGLPVAPRASGRHMIVLSPSQTLKKWNLQVEAFNITKYLDSAMEKYFPESQTPDQAQKQAEAKERAIREVTELVSESIEQYKEASASQSGGETESIPAPSIKFHPGANLLVVIGQPETVAVAAKVIGALPGVQHSTVQNRYDLLGSDFQNNYQQRLQEIINNSEASVQRTFGGRVNKLIKPEVHSAPLAPPSVPLAPPAPQRREDDKP